MQASKEDRPFTFNYIMVHEPIQGLWGKTKETKRRRRCQSFTPDERVQILKQIGRYIADPPIPGSKQTALIPKKIRRDEERLGAKMMEGEAQSYQEPIQHKGPVFFPSGKRLTTCTTCNKPGYKYKTYFQHSNEPPIGPRMLKGKQDGWRYKRCSFTKGKVKQVQLKTIRLIDSASEQTALRQTISGESSQSNIVKKLESYIEENGPDLIKENDSTRDYRKMYWDLIGNLRKIVDQASGIV
jgi:hypothetical protein